MTYPSGRQVNYVLDAADRVTTVQNITGNGNYATLNYKASGAVNAMTTGNGVTQTFSWNDRVQPTGLAVTGSGQTSLLTLGFFPCASGATSCTTGNNGNLQSQTIALPGLSMTQSYSYDHLSRLTGAAETGGAGWTQNYGYDALGNRWVMANEHRLANSDRPEMPKWQSPYSAGTIPEQDRLPWTHECTNVPQLEGNLERDAGKPGKTENLERRCVELPIRWQRFAGEQVTGGWSTVCVYDACGNAGDVSTSTELEASRADAAGRCYVTR